MGYHTSSVIAFLLTLFNVRLGWWFPNPGKTANGSMSPHFSLRYLSAELFGGATDKSSFVMVSDGGHFENLAAYELIRRKCRVIVISDGEPNEPDKALQVASKFKNRIDVVSVGPEDRPAGRDFLKQLAAASGGQVVTADKAAQLSGAVQRLLLA